MLSKPLYHSFDENIMNGINETQMKYDFTFLSSSRALESRYYALRQLLEQTDLKTWINEQETVKSNNSTKQNVRNLLKGALKTFNNKQVNKLTISKYLPRKIKNIFYEIAKAGQARTLKDHTIMNRSKQMDDVIQKIL